MRALLQLASSRRTAYSEALGAWCDDKGREVVGSRLIHLLHRALGSLGLVSGSPYNPDPNHNPNHNPNPDPNPTPTPPLALALALALALTLS